MANTELPPDGIARLYSDVGPSELNAYIETLWAEARAQSDYAQLAGIPVRARREEGQFGVAETILISVAGGVTKDAILGVWEAFIWPRIKAKYGAEVKPAGDVAT